MIEMPSEADVRCGAETIFDLIVDFRGQDRWLGKSSAFHGTEDISLNPVALGTTYREPGPLGVRNGTVIEFERPVKVTFRQPMTLKFRAGTIDATVRYTLTPGPASTHVRRSVTISVAGPLRLFERLIAREFRAESGRTLLALKAYADTISG